MPATTPRKGLPRPFLILCTGFGVVMVLYAALSAVAFGVRQKETTTTSYGAVEQLRIDGGSGDVTVIGEERDDVRVVAHASWGLAKPDREQQLTGSALKVDGGCGFWGNIGVNTCTTDYEIHVPRDTQVTADADAGDVRAVGLRGRVSLNASSGDVRAEDVTGELSVNVSSGDVTVVGYGGRDVSVNTSSGDLEVRTRVAPDRVKAITASGDVTVAVPGGDTYNVLTDTESGDRDVQVDQSVDAKRTIEARTSSGDVRVVRLADAR
ncbi:DUF4097 family beta strand repeat-containing protein [Conexibacter woesei]|uniref:DUF4097 family beta strand repeat-containing protein n=1 Tax=Conexibacter woesei TaxID=191495 RepID=UPI0003168962|nr:DUF4097 family beta strand repeat-containing protein [Conexibacter woesei]